MILLSGDLLDERIHLPHLRAVHIKSIDIGIDDQDVEFSALDAAVRGWVAKYGQDVEWVIGELILLYHPSVQPLSAMEGTPLAAGVQRVSYVDDDLSKWRPRGEDDDAFLQRVFPNARVEGPSNPEDDSDDDGDEDEDGDDDEDGGGEFNSEDGSGDGITD